MNPLTVSALSTHIRSLFGNDELLRDLWVAGEVSNWKRAASGHIYFSLKDAGSTISAVMWRTAAGGLSWSPSEGDQVLAHGYVDLYPERGAYQLYCNMLQPAGRGQLYAAFEALKKKLADEGLFDPERKRPIPVTPQRLGIVTSPDTAALRDILRVLSARWPLVQVIVFPTLVQGAEAPAQIVAALANANRYSATVEPLDVLLLARGGGSIEDLWSFNDERVARAVAASVLPVITGVGHETDFTIVDFVSDLRAPTPSVAAAAATPDRAELLASLVAEERSLQQEALRRLSDERARFEQRYLRIRRIHPQRLIDQQRQRLDDRLRRLGLAIERRLDRERDRAQAALLRLDALNPAAVLQRGFSIVQRFSGEVVMGPEGSLPGELLAVRAAGGSYAVRREPN